MKNRIIARFAFIAVLLFAFSASTFAQADNRIWWNSLPAGWKKIFQDLELKGKRVEPTDEQLIDMVKRTHIDCAGNKQIENLKPLAKLSLLKVLDCSNTNVTSLDGIEQLQNLEVLNCSNNDNINSLIPCTNLQNLIEVNCGNTMVKSLAPLYGHNNLQKLDVHFCTVNNLAPMGELKNLRELNVSQNNSLFSLAGVEKLSQLVEFNCSETSIDDVTPLQNLKVLEILDISNTKVKTLRPLQNVRTIKDIDCSSTLISAASLDYFYSHLRLQFLRARNLEIPQKQIDDFSASFTKKNVNCDVIVTRK